VEVIPPFKRPFFLPTLPKGLQSYTAGRLRAAKILQKRAFANSRIRFIWDSVVDEITGEEAVNGVKVRNLKTEAAADLPADGVFIFAGVDPNTRILHGTVDLDKDGYIIADSNMHTSAEGVFACGDCINKLLRQVVTACGDGATAAFPPSFMSKHSKANPTELLKRRTWKT